MEEKERTRLGAAAHAVTAPTSSPYKRISNVKRARPRSGLLARSVVTGLSQLIEGQKQFADEFGLSLSRVFPQSFSFLDGHSVETIIADIFREGDLRQDDLEKLFKDIFMHQLALVGAIEHVALKTMHELSPDTIRSEINERWVTDGRIWKIYKSKFREFKENGQIRYERLIASGFVPAYARARETNIKN